MADDWLKIRENLHEEPEVLRMAAELDTRPEHVVGYCCRFWGWVSRNVSVESRDKCPAECVTGVRLLSVESVLNLPGFLGLMCEVGWLEYRESDPEWGGVPVLKVPAMDKHLSETAKKRAEDAHRKRAERVRKNSDKRPRKSVTREEKRREEVSKKTTSSYTREFLDWWDLYPRKEGKGKAYSAFKKAKASVPIPKLMAVTAVFARSPKAASEFCPHPATWLNQCRWEDDPAEWSRQSKPAFTEDEEIVI